MTSYGVFGAALIVAALALPRFAYSRVVQGFLRKNLSHTHEQTTKEMLVYGRPYLVVAGVLCLVRALCGNAPAALISSFAFGNFVAGLMLGGLVSGVLGYRLAKLDLKLAQASTEARTGLVVEEICVQFLSAVFYIGLPAFILLA